MSFVITEIHTAFNNHWKGTFVFNGESHPFWEIVFVKSGEVIVTEDEQVFTIHSGQLICHAPMEFHRIRIPDGGIAHTQIVSFFSEGDLPQSLALGFFNLPPDYEDVFDTLFSYCQKVYEKTCDNEYCETVAKCGLTALLAHISATLHPTTNQTEIKKQQDYRNIVNVMTNGAEDALTLPQIARLSAVSVSTVKAIFAEYTGIGPKSYYNNIRAKRAVELLRSGMSVNQVAHKLNFSSPNYFCEFFKKQFGVSPGTYKT